MLLSNSQLRATTVFQTPGNAMAFWKDSSQAAKDGSKDPTKDASKDAAKIAPHDVKPETPNSAPSTDSTSESTIPLAAAAAKTESAPESTDIFAAPSITTFDTGAAASLIPPTPARTNPMTASVTPIRDVAQNRKESILTEELTIEGKIEGSGNVRIAGKFKGDVNVQGNLVIEHGATVTGSVRALTVTIAGTLEGNIEAATRVDLLESGVMTGDVNAESLTVAAGSRMRGKAEFGWTDKPSRKA